MCDGYPLDIIPSTTPVDEFYHRLIQAYLIDSIYSFYILGFLILENVL